MTIKVPYSPFRAVALGFLFLILAGTIVLALPLSSRADVPILDHLFTAASVVSTTGLVTVSVSGTYTFVGQVVLLILMQLGGWGFMTVTSFVLIARQKPLPATKVQTLRASYSLPDDFNLRKFLAGSVVFTLAFEALGAAVLGTFFALEGRPNALWSGVFHSVSAFATAGFSLYDDSLMSFAHHPGVNLTVGGLAMTGAVGFIVLEDFWRAFRHRRPVTFTTKIILVTTGLIVLAGTALVWTFEPSLTGLPWFDAGMAAAFQVVSASSTAGFNTIDLGGLSKGVLFFLILVMVVGASPSGTGGGLKTTTLSALVAVVMSLARGRRNVTLFGNEIPLPRVLSAAGTTLAYLLALAAGTLVLCLVEPQEFLKLFFEATSALGGVGMSTGITAQTGDAGRFVLIVLMYVGRVGPLTFGLSLLGTTTKRSHESQDLVV